MTGCLARIKTCADLWGWCLQHLQRLLQYAAVSALQHVMLRLLLIQVWQPLKGPGDESPLGMIDASTVDMGDLMQITRHSPGRTGYTYAVKRNGKHR